MEPAVLYSTVLFVSLVCPITWSYRRNRPMCRVQRGLRSYLGRTA